jgi:5-methylcytosine-specific restriction protein B
VPGAGRRASGFLDVAAVKSAAEAAGLRLPDAVYANAAAALASGKHLVITGPAGGGKTTLALAIAKAAVTAGRSSGAALATAGPKWSSRDTLGRMRRSPDGDTAFERGHVLAAAESNKWLIVDELERADLDRAFGDLSSFLGGLPLALPDGSGDASAPDSWRIVATRGVAAHPAPAASAALRRRFAYVRLPGPDDADLTALIDEAAGGDATAAGAVRRLLSVRELGELGAGAFLDAARHAAERNALTAASEGELARECLTAYLEPQLERLDDAGRGQLRKLADSL